MKSIFKKIALVLAIAMVVTMLPAKTASVSAADVSTNKWTRKTCTLYIDAPVKGDKDNIYASEAYATAAPKVKIKKDDPQGWATLGYSVTFGTDDPTVAEVGTKYGLVKAVGIGQTTITATYTKGTEVYTESFTVTVKRTASEVALDEETDKVLKDGLTVGDEVVLDKAIMTSADGLSETVKVGQPSLADTLKEREAITDYLKFDVTEGKDTVVKYEDNKLVAVGAGKATVEVIAYRYDWQKFATTSSKYTKVRTAKVSYDIDVAEKDIVATQTAYNKFVLTFQNPEEAKAALDGVNKSLTEANAPVSEVAGIIKVNKILNEGEPRAVYISGASYYGGAEGVTSSVEVTMFQELEEKSKYVISYKNQENIELQTPEYIAHHLVLSSDIIETGDDYSRQKIYVSLYSGEGILLGNDNGSCQKYMRWQDSLVLEDKNTALVHNEYSFDPSGREIWFYTKDQNYTVSLRATYESWEDITDGRAKIVLGEGNFHPGDSTLVINAFVDWCIVPITTSINDANWNSKKFACEDVGSYLVVKANVTELGHTDDVCSQRSVSDDFTFVSSNDDKLSVNKETGELYPSKTASGTVGIHVYYKGRLIGTCGVEIIEKRTFTAFTAQLDNSKISYSSSETDINDNIIITLYPKDQLGANFNVFGMDCVCTVSGTLASCFDVEQIPDKDGNPRFQLTVMNNGADLPENIVNVRVVCKATYTPTTGGNQIVRQYPVTFSIKNTTGGTVTSVKLDVKSSVNMIIDNGDNSVASKNVGIEAFGYDKDGYKVKKLVLNGSDYAVDVKHNGKAVISTKESLDVSTNSTNKSVSGDGKIVTFKPVIVASKEMATISGSAVSVVSSSAISVGNIKKGTLSNVIQKLERGNYVITLYDKDGKTKDSRLLTLTDSQMDQISITWVGNITDEVDEIAAMQKAVKVIDKRRDRDVTDELYFGYVGKEGGLVLGSTTTEDGDYSVTGSTGQNLFVKRVRYAVLFNDGWYEFEIPVMRSVVYKSSIIY